MGTMRRSSTGLFNKVTSVVRKSESKGDLKNDLKVDPNPTPSPAGSLDNVPSPVAESPAREAAAMEQDAAARGPHGASPLVGPPNTSDEPSIAQVLQPTPIAAGANPTGINTAPSLEAQKVVPATQSAGVPAAVSAPNPTPAPAAVSQAAPTPAPEFKSAPAPSNAPTSAPAPVSAPPPAPAPAPALAPSPEAQAAVLAEALVESPESQLLPLPGPAMAQVPVVERRGPDYFTWGDEDTLNPSWKGKEQAIPQPAPQAPASVVAVNQGHADATPPRPSDAQAFAWKDDMVMPTKRSTTSLETGESAPQSMSSEPPAIRLGGVSAKPSKSSMSSYGQVIVNPTRRRVSISVDPNESDSRRGRSPGPSVR